MLAGAGERSMLAQIGLFLREMQLFDFSLGHDSDSHRTGK